MSQYNKLSNIQYARFHILPVDLHFETVLVSWYPHNALYTGGCFVWLHVMITNITMFIRFQLIIIICLFLCSISLGLRAHSGEMWDVIAPSQWEDLQYLFHGGHGGRWTPGGSKYNDRQQFFLLEYCIRAERDLTPVAACVFHNTLC